MTVTAYEIVINAQDKASAVYAKLQDAAKRFKTEHVDAFKSVETATSNLETALKKNEFAFDSWGENIASSFNEMKRTAGATASEVNMALASLGQRSLSSIRQEIKGVGAAFLVLKNSGTASAGELAAAHAKVKARVAELTAEYTRLRAGGTQALGALKNSAAQAVPTTATLASGLGGVQTMLLGIATGVTAKGFFDINAGMQGMVRSLDTITKGKGVETFKALNDWAKVMPVNTQAAIQGFIRMKSMGLEPTIADMTILVDTTQALGGSVDIFNSITTALGQMATKGKVSTEEVLQIAEAGVPVFRYLQQELGLTKDQLANLGAQGIESGRAIKAILKGMQQDFGGLSKSAAGDLANLTESLVSELKDFAARIGGKGFIKYVQDELKGLMDYLSSVDGQSNLDAWATRISDALKSLGETVKTVTTALAPFAKAVAWLATEFPTATMAVLALRTGLGSFSAVFDLFKSGVTGSVKALLDLAKVGAAVKEVGLATAFANVGGALKAEVVAGATAATAGLKSMAASIGVTSVAAAGMAAAVVAAVAGIVVEIGLIAKAWHDAKQAEIAASESIAASMKLVSKNTVETAKALDQLNKKYGTTFKIGQDGKPIVDSHTRARMAEVAAVKKVSNHLQELGANYSQSAQAMMPYYDQAKARSVALAETEKDRIDAAIEGERRRAEFLINSATESANAQIAAINGLQVSQKASADEIKRIHKDLATAKIAALKGYADEVRKMISESIALEKQYSDAARQYRKAAADEAINRQQTINDLLRQGMTEQQKVNSINKELADIRKQVNDLIKKGDEDSLKAAQQLIDRGKTLGTTLAGIPGQLNNGVAAFSGMSTQAELLNTKMAELNEKMAADEEARQKMLLKTFREIDSSIKAVGDALTKLAEQDVEKSVSVVADEQAIASFENKIKELTKTETKVIEVETRQKGGGSDTSAEAFPVETHAIGGLVGEYFRRLARRYVMRGSGLRDDVPALLTRGEFVLNRNAVRYYGRDFVERLNAMAIPAKYHVGGLVERAMAPMRALTLGVERTMEPSFGGPTSPAAPADMGTLNILAGDRSVRVSGRKDDLKWLKQAVGRETLRRKSGA